MSGHRTVPSIRRERSGPGAAPPPVTAGLGSVPVHHRRSQPEIYCQTHALKNVPSDEFRQRIAKSYWT